jgi:hypothetical protein
MVIGESLVLGAIAWFVLMLVGTNLIGIFVRSFAFAHLHGEQSTAAVPSRHASAFLGLTLIVGFLLLLTRFLGPWFAIAAVMLMLGRVPDLIWEIENGKKITLRDIRRTKFSYAITVLSWLALPVSCYGAFVLIR